MKLKTNSVTSCAVRELELKKKDERERRNARVKAVGRIFEYSRVLPPTKATSRLNVTRQTEPAEHQQSSSEASASPNTQRTSALTPAPTLALPLLPLLSLRLAAFYCE